MSQSLADKLCDQFHELEDAGTKPGVLVATKEDWDVLKNDLTGAVLVGFNLQRAENRFMGLEVQIGNRTQWATKKEDLVELEAMPMDGEGNPIPELKAGNE